MKNNMKKLYFIFLFFVHSTSLIIWTMTSKKVLGFDSQLRILAIENILAAAKKLK